MKKIAIVLLRHKLGFFVIPGRRMSKNNGVIKKRKAQKQIKIVAALTLSARFALPVYAQTHPIKHCSQTFMFLIV